MTDRKSPEIVREWTDEHGIRYSEVEGHGDRRFVALDDLAKFIRQIPTEQIEDPIRRKAVRDFQARAATMPPAEAYREAVRLLESFGAPLPPGLRTLRPREVKP